MSEFEFVMLYKKTQVCLFKIPPLSTSKGHYLDDWKEMFWEGGIKLVELQGKLSLQFVNIDGTSVASSVLPEDPYEAVQKTVDSQRGFAIRLVAPGNQIQWVGCVFRDRNDAFDLSAKLQDFLETRDRERNPSKYKDEFQPTKDFGLKQGQKIQLNIEGSGDYKKNQNTKQNVPLNQFKFSQLPDFDQPVKPQAAPINTTQNNQQNADFSNWGTFATFDQKPVSQQNPVQTNWNWGDTNQQTSFQQQQTYQQVQPVQQNKPQISGNTINLLDL